VRSSIEALGMAAERVQFHGVAANEPERLAHVLAAAVTEINEASKE
jgi:coenzyme F420-reducing hydrogenase delta subunit